MASIKYETLADTRKLLEDIEGSFVEAEKVTDDLSNIKQNISFDDTRTNLDNEKDNLLVEKQKIVDKKTDVDNEILTLEARVEEIPSLIEQKEEEIQTILDNSNPYYLRVSGDEFYVRSLREDIKELNDEKDDATIKISNLSIVSDAYQTAQGAFDSFDSTIDDVKSGINNIESAIDGVNNKVDDFVGGIKGQLGGALDGLGDLEGKFDEFTNSIGGGCGIPDLLKDLLIEKLKTLAKKFAAQKSLLVTRQLAAFGTPTGPLGDIAAVAGQVNSIRADVQAKIDQVKGYIATAESFKDGFQALLNGDLDPAAILAFADKWGGDVPGLGGYIDQANDLYNQFQNFDVCSLLPNIVKGADGAVFTEPNEAVAPTKDPEPIKELEPTVEDARLKETETVEEKYPEEIQIEERKQLTLEEEKLKFDEEWISASDNINNLMAQSFDEAESWKSNPDYLSIIKKGRSFQKSPYEIFIGPESTEAEKNAFQQQNRNTNDYNGYNELGMKLANLELIYRNLLTRREPDRWDKTQVIALANEQISRRASANSDYWGDVIQRPNKVTADLVEQEAQKHLNVLFSYASKLYDYWNYSDHYK